jgi:hypothetical protein
VQTGARYHNRFRTHPDHSRANGIDYLTVEFGTSEIPGPPGSDSTSLSISALLGADKHCSFTATLTVNPKHWNGSSIVWDYRVIDPVAFALSQP